jgi:hypothetical protein
MVGVKDLSRDDDDDSDEYDRYPEHPLFPLGEREKSVEISFIQITRLEKGQHKWGPVFPAAELQNEQAILEMFGGGQYILVARKADKRNEAMPGRWTKKRPLTLPGKSRPLSADPAPEEMGVPPTETNVNSNGNSNVPMGGMGDGFMAMITMMMKLSTDSNQQTMNMFMQMMNNAKEDSRRTTELMMQTMTTSQQSTMGLITAVLANRGGGPEEMAKYAELLKTLGVGGGNGGEKKTEGSGESIAGMLENAADIVQGMVALKSSAAPALPPNGTDPNAPPAPPGSAAALIAKLRGGG